MDLHVARFDCRYRVPRQLERIGLRERLDGVARQRLGEAWDRVRAGASHDGRIHCIERLDLDLSVSPTADDAVVARAWAEHLERGIEAAIAKGSARVFEDQAALLAAFVDDILNGRAAGAWYFGDYAPLLTRGMGDAVTCALLDDPDTGREAILRLPRVDSLLGALSDEQAERIAARCLLPESPEVLTPGALSRWTAALGAGLASTAGERGPKRLIGVYVSLLRRNQRLGPDVNFARFIRAVLAAAEAIAASPDAPAVLRALSRGEWQALRPLVPDVRERRLLATAVQQVGGEAVARLLREAAAAPGVELAITTAFGGLYLLVPAALELPLPDPLPPHFIYGVALECLGSENREDALRDRGVCLFAGLTRPPGEAELQALSTDVVTETASALLRGFSARLGAFSASSDTYLRRHFLLSQAVVEMGAERFTVRFAHCSMQIVLRMAGFDAGEWSVPWMGNRRLELRFD